MHKGLHTFLGKTMRLEISKTNTHLSSLFLASYTPLFRLCHVKSCVLIHTK